MEKGKQEKLFQEVVFQIGNKDNMGVGTENGELTKKVLVDFYNGFQEHNPTLRLCSAYLHMDEATPHLHIDFVPFTTESKRGLSIRVSMKQALKDLGFKGGSRSETEFNQWINSEKEYLSKAMLEHGIEWEQLGTQREHLSVLDFKKEERTKEVQELDSELERLRKQKVQVDNINKIEGKKIPLTTKISVEETDFNKLKSVAQKYVTSKSKENNLTKLLKEAEKVISTLKQKVKELSSEISKYKSVTGKIDNSKLKAENKRLKKENSNYKSIMEKHNLELDKGKNNVKDTNKIEKTGR